MHVVPETKHGVLKNARTEGQKTGDAYQKSFTDWQVLDNVPRSQVSHQTLGSRLVALMFWISTLGV